MYIPQRCVTLCCTCSTLYTFFSVIQVRMLHTHNSFTCFSFRNEPNTHTWLKMNRDISVSGVVSPIGIAWLCRRWWRNNQTPIFVLSDYFSISSQTDQSTGYGCDYMHDPISNMRLNGNSKCPNNLRACLTHFIIINIMTPIICSTVYDLIIWSIM